MKRREFLKQSLSASAVIVGVGYAGFDIMQKRRFLAPTDIEQRALMAVVEAVPGNEPLSDEGMGDVIEQLVASNQPAPQSFSRPAISYQQLKADRLVHVPEQSSPAEAPLVKESADEIQLTESGLAPDKGVEESAEQLAANSVQEKVENFEKNFVDDVQLNESEFALLVQTLERVNRVRDYVGFGNFNVLSFDDALRYARNASSIGEFSSQELAFMDRLFFEDSSHLGFFGAKVVDTQTNVIPQKDVVKMPGTGHYVFRGHSEAFYKKIRSEVGDTLILTSGVRNIFKQYQLFMAKAVQANGNLSRASRSLAPPGHSYHAVGDFDVGQVGAGYANFTAQFAETDEFKRLQELGYVKIRYTARNDLGVRYEPWHIRVV